MYPPSAPTYFNTRERLYGDSEIRRVRLKELKIFRGLKVERVRIKDEIPEYIEVTSDGEYFNVRGIRGSQEYGFGYHGKGFMNLLIWLNLHGWSSVI
jgi:hypothetical protein